MDRMPTASQADITLVQRLCDKSRAYAGRLSLAELTVVLTSYMVAPVELQFEQLPGKRDSPSPECKTGPHGDIDEYLK